MMCFSVQARSVKSLWSVVVLLSALFISLNGAMAQTNTHSWIASSGNDASDCSRATPCATFSGAYAKTARSGEITCMDSGEFKGAVITRGVTINCRGKLASNSPGIGSYNYFNILLPDGDTVVIRGVDLDLKGSSVGIPGIYFQGSGKLIVEGVKISGARNPTGGIYFTPKGPGKLVVTDSFIAGNGGASTGAGIIVKPHASGSAQATIERVDLSGNTFGVAVDGSDSTGGVNVTIKDSVLASNTNDGVVATTSAGHSPIGVLVSNSASINNGYGIRAIGSNVTVRVSGSDIAGNGTGLATASGGALLSLGSNAVRANGTNGAFTGAEAVQ
jgi:hypothetical protein